MWVWFLVHNSHVHTEMGQQEIPTRSHNKAHGGAKHEVIDNYEDSWARVRMRYSSGMHGYGVSASTRFHQRHGCVGRGLSLLGWGVGNVVVACFEVAALLLIFFLGITPLTWAGCHYTCSSSKHRVLLRLGNSLNATNVAKAKAVARHRSWSVEPDLPRLRLLIFVRLQHDNLPKPRSGWDI